MTDDTNATDEVVLEISISEYEAIKAVSTAIAAQNALIIKTQEDAAKSLMILAEAIKQKREIVIPAPEVTVEAAKQMEPMMMPPMPAPMVINIIRIWLKIIQGLYFNARIRH